MKLNLDVDGVIVVFLDDICFTGDLRLTLRIIFNKIGPQIILGGCREKQ